MKHLLANPIHVFLAIVEAGSITAAAERLAMGKSGVSDALKQLEVSLGVQLLIRTTRRQNLTPIGEQFYRRCRELSDLSTNTLEEINQHLAEPMGAMRITAPHATIEYCIAPALARLIERYPRLQPELIIDDKRLDLIEQKIDLALTVGALPDSEFKAQRAGLVKDVLCAAPSFLQKHGINAQTKLSAFKGLPYVANHWEGKDNSYSISATGTNDSPVTLSFNRVAKASSVNAVLALIKEGVGIGMLPHFILQPQIACGQLVELLPKYKPRATGIYTLHPFGLFPPLSVRAMINEIKQTLATISL